MFCQFLEQLYQFHVNKSLFKKHFVYYNVGDRSFITSQGGGGGGGGGGGLEGGGQF